MTKVKLKDATKELATGAGAVLNDATRVRKSADTLMQSLRKLEVKFTREEEERVAKEKREAQEKLLSSHSKAFTMPDDDEPQSAPVPGYLPSILVSASVAANVFSTLPVTVRFRIVASCVTPKSPVGPSAVMLTLTVCPAPSKLPVNGVSYVPMGSCAVPERSMSAPSL